jgi:hypothetical protein
VGLLRGEQVTYPDLPGNFIYIINHILIMPVKTNIFRLISVVKHGVGGSGAGMLDLIFSFLLQEFELDIYSYITINQIGDDLNEFVMKEGKNVHINIRYPVFEILTLNPRSNKIKSGLM